MKRVVTNVPLLAALASIVIMAAALLIKPVIGMADNGDFYRSINGQGIYKLDRHEDDQFFQYFSSKYGIYQYYNETEKSLLSVQNLYIQAAKLLNAVFGPDKAIFDIRFLSVFLILQLAAGMYLLVDYIAWKRSLLQKWLLAVVGVVMFVDTAYTAYFNSFYAEGIVYVSFLLLTVSALLMTQDRYSPYPLLASVLVNGIILIFTKQQNATAGAVLFLLCILMGAGFRIVRPGFRRIAFTGALVMGISGVVMYLSIPDTYVTINQYHAMTRGALMTGQNPEETLEQFGIDRQYSILDGTIYFERYPSADVESPQLKEGFYNKYGFVSLTAYYLTHPDELMAILNKAANNGYMIRPDFQGNYERSAGRQPGEKTNFFTFYSEMKKTYVPNTVGFVVIWMLVVCGISFRDRRKLMVIICTIIMGLIQVGTSIIGAGDADLAKHIFLYNVSFDLVSFICFAPILTGWLSQLLTGVFRMAKRHKKAAVPLAVIFLSISFSLKVSASEAEEQAVIICHQGEDVEWIRQLADACGMDTLIVREQEYEETDLEGADYAVITTLLPLADIRSRKLPALCLGTEFTDMPGLVTQQYYNRMAQLSYDGYEEDETFETDMTLLSSASGDSIGKVKVGGESEFPFASLAEDGNYYAPFYRSRGLSAILVGNLLQRLQGETAKGRLYFTIDEVYPFSDLEKLCVWGEDLYSNGIPYLVRVMPVYDNLEYPSFLRYTQALRYLQARGGTIVRHEPLVVDQQTEREPLDEKLERFGKAMEAQEVHCREFVNMPYQISMDELMGIRSGQKQFGTLPANLMTGINVEADEEEFQQLLLQIEGKWMAFTDYRKEFTDSTYLYESSEIPQEFKYREREEAAFTGFFTASDQILLIVVGVSLIVFFLLLSIGGRWYKRKFYR